MLLIFNVVHEILTMNGCSQHIGLGERCLLTRYVRQGLVDSLTLQVLGGPVGGYSPFRSWGVRWKATHPAGLGGSGGRLLTLQVWGRPVGIHALLVKFSQTSATAELTQALDCQLLTGVG